MTAPLVSVLVPCRNEAHYIERCLASILDGEYPADRLEVLVVDGMSDDGTRELVARYAAAHPAVRLLDNPRRTTPVALNLGVRAARGDCIVLVGAHNEYPADFLSQSVAWLERSGADVVGGVCETRPGRDDVVGRAIAGAMTRPFGVGNSRFRIGAAAPCWVDTVPFGCYRRDVFERIGLFDEELVRNQDDELNLRLLRRGGRILLVPQIASRYYARATLEQVARMFYQYGLFKPLVAHKVGRVLTVRQVVPAVFVAATLAAALAAVALPAARPGLAALGAVYGLADLASAASLVRRAGPRSAALAMLVFPLLHFSYGVGSLRGLAALLAGRPPGGHDAAAVPLTR
ncbi:MAG TPA: glycosyltransferase family 2 protein [Longimicrobiales bacterium]|nr:glycosyltransferase family 2 protein [Longimicrobiales bacterium]